MRLRLCLLLPAKVNKLASKIAKQVALNQSTAVVVNNEDRFPHITLFVMKFDKRNLQRVLNQVIDRLEEAGSKTLDLVVDGFKIYDDLWLTLFVKPNKNLDSLEDVMLREVRKIVAIDGKGKRDERHISLVRFKDTKVVNKIVKKIKPPRETFKADRIALCLSDDFGQVYKVVKEFRLKK